MLWTTRALAFDDQGRWLEAQSTGVDIHDRKRAEEHTKLLLNELNHRVKNTLAVVQGIAQQTFKDTDPVGRQAFEGRLAALSKAHSLLTERSWSPAPLRAIVADVSHVCGAARDRIRAEGPDVMLSPRQALSIAMALHELCTNAVKYGALSNDSGVVNFTWGVRDGVLEMHWRESGGPKVEAPKARGYGSRMIERALAHDLQGTARLDFRPEGVVCVIDAPLEP
jgi:two-component sensor histidine kinase